MSATMLQALLLFWLILTILAGILYQYQLARWRHSQRQIPRPVDLGELRGEVHLLEVRGYDGGEMAGSVRLWVADHGLSGGGG